MLGSIRQLEVLFLQLCAHLKDLLLRGRSVYPADLVPIDGEGPMVRRREVVKFTRFWILADLFDLHGWLSSDSIKDSTRFDHRSTRSVMISIKSSIVLPSTTLETDL